MIFLVHEWIGMDKICALPGYENLQTEVFEDFRPCRAGQAVAIAGRVIVPALQQHNPGIRLVR